MLLGRVRDGDADGERLEIVAVRSCQLRIDLGDRPDFATSFRVLDESGRPLTLEFDRGDVAFAGEVGLLRDGGSGVVGVLETARTLVLLRGDQEVSHVPLALSPDELTTFEL